MKNKKAGHEVNTLQFSAVAKLRLKFLLPLSLAIIIMLCYLLYKHEDADIERDILRTSITAQKFYNQSIDYDAKALMAIMSALQLDSHLHKLLKAQDRQGLIDYATPTFKKLKNTFAITHFYFIAPNRKDIVRIHAPNMYGDTINRVTTLRAEKSMKTVFGVELGPLGTLTLRLVTPWFDEATHHLIGYVELGMETNKVAAKLQDFFRIKAYVLIHKNKLDQKKWVNGMKAMRQAHNWNRFPKVVLEGSGSSLLSLPPSLNKLLKRGQFVNTYSTDTLSPFVSPLHIIFLPIKDVQNHSVATMALVTNLSKELNISRHIVFIGSLTAIVVGMFLISFGYWQLGKIGHRLERDRIVLEHLASHDGLTGLINHRVFWKELETEIFRADRYQNTLSLLMIDIDHFKQINDNYGHQAGDIILKNISNRFAALCRITDKICRYGGEEFIIISPESNGVELAERLRIAIETIPFEIEKGKQLHITISIGVATYPENANNSKSLVKSVDVALYNAKAAGRNRVVKSE